MAAFRKLFPALAVLVLLGLVTTASAQTAAFQCTANAGVPPLARSEGLTELTGDILLNCTGGTPTTAGNQIPAANISIFLNTAVTSRLISGTAVGNSEALLMIDEPAAAEQLVCNTAPTCAVLGIGGGALAFKSGASNVWIGTVSGNSITFIGVPVEPPGTAGTRIYRITNIRANASAVAPGGFGTPGQIVALISATPATGPSGTTSSFPINNPQQIVGYVQSGLTFSLRNAANSDALSVGSYGQCQTRTRTSTDVVLRFTENFATSFKTRTAVNTGSIDVSPAPVPQAVPGLIYNSESGFYNPALTIPANAGLADFGTRLKATFTNIPAGVRLFVTTSNIVGNVPITNGATGLTSLTLARLVGGESGAFFPVTATDTSSYQGSLSTYAPVYEITPATGSNTTSAVWEVLAADPLTSQNYDFGVFFGWTAAAATNSPAIGSGSVAGSFAPIPPIFSATDGAKAQNAAYPIPRFVDTGSAKPFFRIFQCRTNLLFPFVTNQAGFDTGLAISNTSQDPFGTAPQAGTCDLNFYGANAPSVITTSSIAGGSVYTTLASSAAPNFQGYVIAVCNFQYGHGFAFVSDLGARNLAMGYLALVMPDPARNSTGGYGVNAVSITNIGEVLGQ